MPIHAKSLFAENYVVTSSVTSMSIAHASGSTIFGDTIDDTHRFTGSLYIGTGSIESVYHITASGNISGSSTSIGSFGSVYTATHITASGNISGSATSTGSFGAAHIRGAGGADLSLITQDKNQTADENLGTISFKGWNSDVHSSPPIIGAMIKANVDAVTWNTDDPEDAPTELAFYTQNEEPAEDRLAAPSMLIDKDGKVGIGCTIGAKVDPANHGLTIDKFNGGAFLTLSGLESAGQYNGILIGANEGNYIHGGVFFERTGNAAVGSLHLAVSTVEDGGVADLDDAKLTINSSGHVLFPMENQKISGSSTSTGSFGAGYIDNKLGIGTTAPDTNLHIHKATAGTVDAITNTVLTVENSTNGGINILTPNDAIGFIAFGDPDDSDVGYVMYNHDGNKLQFSAGAAIRMTVDGNNGRVGIGNTAPPEALTVTGDISGSGHLRLSPTKRVVFDQLVDNHTYLLESSADNLRAVVGGSEILDITTTKISGSSTSTGSFGMVGVGVGSPTHTLHVDAGGTNDTLFYLGHSGTSGLKITAANDHDVEIDSKGSSGDMQFFVQSGRGFYWNAKMVPWSDATHDLGTTAQSWRNIYATGNISSSVSSTGSFGMVKIAKDGPAIQVHGANQTRYQYMDRNSLYFENAAVIFSPLVPECPK